MKLYQLFFVSFMPIFLIACDSDNHHSELSVTGKVMDDPIQNAKVCLDCNGNWSCDEAEPFSYSEENGRYKIYTQDFNHIQHCPRLAEINQESVDEVTGYNIEVPHKLISPAKCNFITPITSLLHQQMTDGTSYDEAEKEIQAMINTHSPICSDYMAEQGTDDFVEDTPHLRQIANVSAGYLQMNLAQMKNWTSFDDTQQTEMYSYLLHNIKKVMPLVLEDLKQFTQPNAEADEANPQNISSSFSLPNFGSRFFRHFQLHFPHSTSEPAANIDFSVRDVKEEMSILELMKHAEPLNLAYQYGYAFAYSGFRSPHVMHNYGLVSYQDSYSEQNYSLSYTTETSSNEEELGNIKIHQNQYNWINNEFEIQSTLDNAKNTLTSKGFGTLDYDYFLQIPNDKDWKNITFDNVQNDYSTYYSDDSGTRFRMPTNTAYKVGLEDISDSSIRTQVTAKAYNISGKRVSSLLHLQSNLTLWNKIINPDIRFEDGAMAFNVNRKSASHYYTFPPLGSASSVAVLRPVRVKGDYFRFDYLEERNVTPQSLLSNTYDQLKDMLILNQDDESYYVAFFRTYQETVFTHANGDFYNPTGYYIDSTKVVEVYQIPKDPNYTAKFNYKSYNKLDVGNYPKEYVLHAPLIAGRGDNMTWDRTKFRNMNTVIFNISNNAASAASVSSGKQLLFSDRPDLKLLPMTELSVGTVLETDQFHVGHSEHRKILSAIVESRAKELTDGRQNLNDQ